VITEGFRFPIATGKFSHQIGGDFERNVLGTFKGVAFHRGYLDEEEKRQSELDLYQKKP